MAMVGQTQSRVHRRYKPQKSRWMAPPPKKKVSGSDIGFYFQACIGMLAMVITLFVVWWYSY